MQPWKVTTDPLSLRRIGKAQEELAELQKVLARITIQDINGSDPKTGESNFAGLWKEIADVAAQSKLLTLHFGLPPSLMVERSRKKIAQMEEWEEELRKEANGGN